VAAAALIRGFRPAEQVETAEGQAEAALAAA
jgi:hypothetical protein